VTDFLFCKRKRGEGNFSGLVEIPVIGDLWIEPLIISGGGFPIFHEVRSDSLAVDGVSLRVPKGGDWGTKGSDFFLCIERMLDEMSGILGNPVDESSINRNIDWFALSFIHFSDELRLFEEERLLGFLSLPPVTRLLVRDGTILESNVRLRFPRNILFPERISEISGKMKESVLLWKRLPASVKVGELMKCFQP